jgi:hypothetical protein
MLVAAEFSKALRAAGFNPEFGDEYINIARQDGIHVEFYGPRGVDFVVFAATYHVDGRETDIDIFICDSDGIRDAVSIVQKILNRPYATR